MQVVELQSMFDLNTSSQGYMKHMVDQVGYMVLQGRSTLRRLHVVPSMLISNIIKKQTGPKVYQLTGLLWLTIGIEKLHSQQV